MGRTPLWAAVAGAAVAVAGLAAPATPASAGDPPTVSARWEMNESAGATVMHDSGVLHLDGSINPAGVSTGFTFDGATGYHWDRRSPTQPPASPERVITVPDNPLLDVGAGTFTLEIRYRTNEKFGNIIQKGQAHSVGGQWKVQAPGGVPSCLFRGSLGVAATGAITPINDNKWHVLTCVKTPASVTLYVDGEYRSRKNRDIGTMDNKKPMTIGGKLECDQITATCDYFSGDIDYVSITKPEAGPYLSATIAPKSVEIGQRFTVSGTVVDGSTGSPYASVPIHLFGQPKGASSFVDRGIRTQTNANGSFSFTYLPKATNEWYVSTGPEGSGLDSDSKTVKVVGKATIHLDDKSVKSGTKVTFFGKARPAQATLVKLQRKQQGHWITKKTTVPSDNHYSVTWHPKSKTDFSWRVRVIGPNFASAASRTLILKVR